MRDKMRIVEEQQQLAVTLAAMEDVVAGAADELAEDKDDLAVAGGRRRAVQINFAGDTEAIQYHEVAHQAEQAGRVQDREGKGERRVGERVA